MELYDPNNAQLAKIAKALSNEDRLSIIKLLLEKEMSVSDIQSELLLEQSTTSHHLSILCKNGFIEREQRGVFVYYKLADEYNDVVKKIFTEIA